MVVGPVGCVVPEMPVLIFKSIAQNPHSTPNYRAGSELVGSTLLSSLGICRPTYELTDETTLH